MNWANYWFLRQFAGRKVGQLYLIFHATHTGVKLGRARMPVEPQEVDPRDLKRYARSRGGD